MMNINSRSVLRPEYLDHSFNFGAPAGCENNDEISLGRINTNTAPVYANEETSQPKRCLSGNKRALPKDIPSGSHSIDFAGRSVKISCYDSDSQDSVETSQDNSSSPCTSYVSKFSCDSMAPNFDPKSHSRPSRPASEASTSNSRSHAHGQAEQIRRTRESITFALINDQLSKPPLNKVRDMYLATRSESGQSHSSARTTKKANLSVVHAIIRCRIKQYLIELREYINRSLDRLFSHMYEDYDVLNRDKLANEVLGITPLPCSPGCQYCPRLTLKPEQFRLWKRESRLLGQNSNQQVDQIPSTSSQMPLSQPSTPQPLIPACQNQMPLSQIIPSDSTIPEVICESNLSPDAPQPTNCELDDLPDDPLNCSLSQYTFSESSALLEKPLPAYHIDDSRNKNMGLNSTSLQSPDDFENIDWRTNDLDFGPCKEEIVDSDSLAFDSSSGTPSRIDDSLYDPAYDVGDLMHHFTMDKHPGLQLTISP